MGSLEGRSSKRRKLSTDDENVFPALPIPFSDYIILARANLETDRVDESKSSTNDAVPLEVILRSVTPHLLGADIDLSIRRGASKKHVVVNDTLSEDLQILEDAQKLESAAKYKAPAALPLACAYATFRERDQIGRLDVCILWQNTIAVRDKVDPILLEILARYLPPATPISPIFESWEPREFYNNVHVPEKSEANSAEIKIPYIESQLYPFQRRGVRWLLAREGVVEKPDGVFSAHTHPASQHSPQGIEEFDSPFNGRCYVNHTLGVASTSRSAIQKKFAYVHGGILADEMGLGKTLEIIALICLNPRPSLAAAPQGLRQSSATMIITPPSILEQWKSELQEHAPSLKVFHYKGVNEYKKSGEDLIDKLLSQDVVLTTYNVIAKEVHFVAEKPDRNLRNSDKRKDPPKSPLTQFSWWRVCLDEAQQVESGVSAAATVARLIPRTNAWAVTGTPLRKGHRDLFGLFLFLGYEPWCHSPRLWDHLVTYHRPLFRAMLGEIAIRHSKDFVREDLRLPPQDRHTITIPFTAIEEQHYTQLFQEFCEDCDLDRTGAPLNGNWDPESPEVVEKMRTWLTRLRQTCLHPEVGGRNRRALGRNTNGPLRTVDEVLDVMIDQLEGHLRTAQRNHLIAKIRRGQLHENAKASSEALKIWREAQEGSMIMVSECKAKYDQVRSSLSLDDEKFRDGDEAHLASTVLARLRSALEIKHVVLFFLGNAFFQLKAGHPPESEQYQELEEMEMKAYEIAKSTRTQLLHSASRNVNKLVAAMGANLSRGSTQVPIMEEPSAHGGIESRKIFQKLHYYCEAMNIQAEQFNELRTKMATFLNQALIDQEDIEVQGDEYETSTKHQDEMYAIMEALRALLADRMTAITGQENVLIKEEMKQFLRNAKEGEGPAPEVFIKLLAEREQKRVKVNEMGSLRGIIGQYHPKSC